ncbi:MAG: thioredoxin family protein [Candidatus Firestonebacteria bacterium]|nr:thioredoxin family protein [Candidatus Firestonebacteria bacterium]
MEIKVLGTGCPKCKKLYELVQETVREVAVEAEVVKVEKIEDIMKYNVMLTPALVVNGVLKASGRLPSKAEITNWVTK